MQSAMYKDRVRGPGILGTWPLVFDKAPRVIDNFVPLLDAKAAAQVSPMSETITVRSVSQLNEASFKTGTQMGPRRPGYIPIFDLERQKQKAHKKFGWNQERILP